MHELAAWILFPLIALAICTGIGLLATRLARFDPHPALVPALGFATAIAVLGPLFATGVGGSAGCILLVVLAIAGAALAVRESDEAPELVSMRPGLGALAGVAVYALHIAPVALTGQTTFLGYNLLNDTAIHLAIVDWIGDHGSHFIHQPPSSYGAAINDYVGSRYPLGSHELLAALKPIVGLDPAALYQPFLALCAGIAAAAIFGLIRDALRPDVAVLIAVAALASQLVYSFALQGSIKELAFIVCLAAAAGVARSPALLALPAAALWSIYGIYALPWIVPLALAALILTRPSLRAAAVGVAVFLVAIAVYVPDSIHYYNHGHKVLTSGEELGPLAGPLKPIQTAGIWLNGDYRFSPDRSWLTYALDIGVLLLALFGVLRSGRLRVPLLMFVVPALAAYAITAPSSSPYIDAKLLAILSPAILLAACLGLVAVRLRALAIAGAVVLALALVVSDALAYRIALPAPTARLGELAQIDKRFAGKGPLLVNEYEEYVKHYMRRSKGSDPYESWTAARAQLRNPKLKVAGHRYDLDQMTTAYVERWPYIVVRRSPVASRPPSNYDRVYSGRWYEVWQRKRPAPAEHIALQTSQFNPTALIDCKQLPPGRVVAAYRPPPRAISISSVRPLPPGWYVYGQDRRMLELHKGGQILILGQGPGPFQLWLRGRTTRNDVLGGVRVPRMLQRIDEWLPISPSPLNAQMNLSRPKRSARPGDAQPDIIGPLVAAPDTPPRLVNARDYCDRPADWVDVYRSSNQSG